MYLKGMMLPDLSYFAACNMTKVHWKRGEFYLALVVFLEDLKKYSSVLSKIPFFRLTQSGGQLVI